MDEEDLDEAGEMSSPCRSETPSTTHIFLHLCITSFRYGKDELNLGKT